MVLILGLSLCAAMGLSAIAQTVTIPVRPLAQAMATTNHAPFPLVTADSSGEVRFALSEFADGLAHFYTFIADGLPVEFFVIWTSDNMIRTALNACDVCYRGKLGYRQDGQFMVCNNCGNRFPVGQIDVANGGCNPTPLSAQIDAGELVISAADLAAGLAYFR